MAKILIACEYSGIIRDAFENRGFDAYSCDIIDTTSEQTKNSEKHIKSDVREILDKGWDLMIGHPPCTYLSFAFTHKTRYSDERLQNKLYAYQFFLDLWKAPVKHICIENPMGYIHTGLLPCTQIIEPYYFGDEYKKKTCLWLKNLPKLEYSLGNDLFRKQTAVTPRFTYINCTPKSRRKLPAILKPFASAKEKSKFHKGIANAMAEQWGDFIIKKDIKP
ncbi:MAG: hypothetical protein LBF04_04170 [Prevotellaceae bacterium]|jgi:site-specific DNA-cytosine methylase|nr:hypothetical protein [Prevotellaceae bacterium]